MLKVEEGWVGRLFSEEEGWGEDEPKYVEGLGWIIFDVLDTAGSIMLVVTKEKLEHIPYEDLEWNAFKDDPNTITICKVAIHGSYGNDIGEGALYTRLVGNVYMDKKGFMSFSESDKVLEEYLNGFKS